MRTAHIVVEATLDPWQLTFRDAGRPAPDPPGATTTSTSPAIAWAPGPGSRSRPCPQDPARRAVAVVDNLLLDPEDHFYGGGERFRASTMVGRTIRIWNRNPYGARSELAYKNIPLLVGSRGLRPLRGRADRRDFHVGSRSNRTYTVEADGPRARLLPARRLAEGDRRPTYTELTGKPAVPPEWAFGLWASTCFVKFTEASVLAEARRLPPEGIPCDVFHLDSFWQRAYMWCDFEWDAERAARPEAPHGRAPPRRLPQLSVDQSLRLAARARSTRRA